MKHKRVPKFLRRCVQRFRKAQARGIVGRDIAVSVEVSYRYHEVLILDFDTLRANSDAQLARLIRALIKVRLARHA